MKERKLSIGIELAIDIPLVFVGEHWIVQYIVQTPDRQQGKELDTAIVLGEGIRPGIGILISWEYWGTGSDYIDRILSPMIMIGDYYWRAWIHCSGAIMFGYQVFQYSLVNQNILKGAMVVQCTCNDQAVQLQGTIFPRIVHPGPLCEFIKNGENGFWQLTPGCYSSIIYQFSKVI